MYNNSFHNLQMLSLSDHTNNFVCAKMLLTFIHNVFFKFLSSPSFVKSRQLWVHLLDLSSLLKQ